MRWRKWTRRSRRRRSWEEAGRGQRDARQDSDEEEQLESARRPRSEEVSTAVFTCMREAQRYEVSTAVFATEPTKCREPPGPARLGFDPRRGDKQMLPLRARTEDDDDRENAHAWSLWPKLPRTLGPPGEPRSFQHAGRSRLPGCCMAGTPAPYNSGGRTVAAATATAAIAAAAPTPVVAAADAAAAAAAPLRPTLTGACRLRPSDLP